MLEDNLPDTTPFWFAPFYRPGSTIVAYRVEHLSRDYDDFDAFYGYRSTLKEAEAFRHFILENLQQEHPAMDWERFCLPRVTISPVTV